MNNLPKDLLIVLALNLEYEEILNLCQTNKRVNDIVCKNKLFWKQKLVKEYPNINIDNVTNYKGLYGYLNYRSNENIQGWGKLSPNGLAVLGSEGQYYGVLTRDRKLAYFQGSGLDFPKFPPNFFLNLGTNVFILKYTAKREIAKNIKGNISHVTGPYDEIYKVIIKKDNIDKNLFDKTIEWMKEATRSSSARFKDGIIHMDFYDDYSSLL